MADKKIKFQTLKDEAKDLNKRFGLKIKTVGISADNLTKEIIKTLEGAPINNLLVRHKMLYEQLTGNKLDASPKETKPVPKAKETKPKLSPPPDGCECEEFGKAYDPSLEDCIKECDYGKECKTAFVKACEAGLGKQLDPDWKEFYEGITGKEFKLPTKKKDGGKKEPGSTSRRSPSEIKAFVSKMVSAGKYTRKDIISSWVEENGEQQKATVGTYISDGKNPKYNSFEELIKQDEEGVLSFS